MENWMRDLPEAAKKVSIIYLAIPGSHNSMTYEINRHSEISPDADDTVRKVDRIFPRIVRRWAKTQGVDVTTQLCLGVRYFDLRICLKDKSSFYFAHGCYSCEVFKVLDEINKFLDEHPTEFLILDFQHFYNLTIEDHRLLQYNIGNIFGKKLYGRIDGSLTECNLEYAWENKKQIIIIYRCRYFVPQLFWTSEFWPTPWPNTCSIKNLENFLDTNLLYRSPHVGYVSQCIITPSPRYIVIRFLLSLKYVAKKVNKEMDNWIKSQRPGIFQIGDRPLSNVFIVDFIEIRNGEFCRNVVQLNNLIDCCDK